MLSVPAVQKLRGVFSGVCPLRKLRGATLTVLVLDFDIASSYNYTSLYARVPMPFGEGLYMARARCAVYFGVGSPHSRELNWREGLVHILSTKLLLISCEVDVHYGRATLARYTRKHLYRLGTLAVLLLWCRLSCFCAKVELRQGSTPQFCAKAPLAALQLRS